MNWNDVMNYSKQNLPPEKEVKKSDEEWKAQLTPEQYRVTLKANEAANVRETEMTKQWKA